jgi:hypothetical protein
VESGLVPSKALCRVGPTPRQASSERHPLVLGAIVSVLLSLVVIDLKTLLLNVTVLAVVSYLIRVLALFSLGGLVGWLHKTEHEPTKLFQLGIAAPALLTVAINGSNVSLPDKSVSLQSSASVGFIAENPWCAHAATRSKLTIQSSRNSPLAF